MQVKFAPNFVCDKNLLAILKTKFYIVVVRSTMIYGVDVGQLRMSFRR